MRPTARAMDCPETFVMRMQRVRVSRASAMRLGCPAGQYAFACFCLL